MKPAGGVCRHWVQASVVQMSPSSHPEGSQEGGGSVVVVGSVVVGVPATSVVNPTLSLVATYWAVPEKVPVSVPIPASLGVSWQVARPRASVVARAAGAGHVEVDIHAGDGRGRLERGVRERRDHADGLAGGAGGGRRDDHVLPGAGGRVRERGVAAGARAHHLEPGVGAAHLEEDGRALRIGGVTQRRREGAGGALRRVGRDARRRQPERGLGFVGLNPQPPVGFVTL